MEKLFLFAVLVLSIATGLTIGNSSSVNDLISTTLEEINKMDKAPIIDCQGQYFTCNEGAIEERPESCNPWSHWEPESKLECNYTSESIESISLVTDPGNYVNIPKKDDSYRVNKPISDTGRSPWDIEFLPSGKPIWTTISGELRKYQNNTKVAELEVVQVTNTGLLGLAIDPDYSENNLVYMYYTFEETAKTNDTEEPVYLNRISRFKYDEGLENEKVLVDEIPGGKHHSGGRLDFGPDGKLYATTGDANIPHKAQNRSSLAGKVLRINTNGTVPDDNPFEDSYIYSHGHRNPQGLDWHPDTEEMFISEHGEYKHDEINRIKPGENYGWPGYECDKEREPLEHLISKYRELSENFQGNTLPVYCFKDWTIAPSGATFVDDSDHPWHGDMFVAGLRGKQIFRLQFDDGEPSTAEVFYVSKDEPEISLRLREVEYHDGALYAIGDLKGSVKIKPE